MKYGTLKILIIVALSAAALLAAGTAYADTQNFTSGGTFTVPAYETLTVTVNGAGGGGGGAAGVYSYTCGKSTCYAGVAGVSNGGTGGGSSFNTTVVGNAGGGGVKAPGTTSAGGAGSSGTASGGDTNTTGGGAGGGSGPNNCNGYGSVTLGTAGAGGAGGQAVKTYSPGGLTIGAGITVTVGSGAGGGTGGTGSEEFGGGYCNGNTGGTGTAGNVSVTWTPDTTAPTPNPATFSSAPAPASASSVSMTSTTGSDSAGNGVNYLLTFSACGANGGTGGTSSSWQASASYTDSGLQPNKCYGYTIQMKDNSANTGTASSQNTTYTNANVPSAPTLSGASYTTMVITNNENSNPLSSPATLFAAYVTSADANWNGKYVAANGSASASAVWLTDAQLTSLTLTGMANNTSYTIGVKARNESSVETSVGTTAALSTLNDATAPTPNPATFSSAPAPASASSVSMTASTATDAAGSTPVAYLLTFSACGANGGTGGTSSSWQASASYTDSGLQPNKCYGYTVQSRDSIPNTGTASSQNTTYTNANVPSAPTLSGASYTTMVITNNENSNPLSSPATLFAAYVTSADANWNGKYVAANGSASASAVWLTDAQLTSLTLTGMANNTSYTIGVKARNESSVETSVGTTAALSTLNVSAPTVTTQSASSVTATAATLNGNITATNGANATVRGFAWGSNSALSGGDTATTTENGSFSTGTFTDTSLTLVCDTTYYSRAYATNSADTGLGSISASFTTSSCTPTVSAISPNTATNSDSVSITSVTGTNFVSGATVKLTKAAQSDVSCTGFTFTDSTTLSSGSCPITGAAVGSWSVVVTNPDTSSGTLTNGFTVTSPSSSDLTISDAVSVVGDVTVTSNLTKGSGTFVIDHPIDPAGKLLYHSFVESPDALNEYTGTIKIGKDGEARVRLPDYFEALNGDYQYFVRPVDTPMGGLYIKQEVKNNTFVIAGGVPGGEVSWMVTGIRRDPYILANPIVPEVEKGPGQLVDKGEYLFPGYAPRCSTFVGCAWDGFKQWLPLGL